MFERWFSALNCIEVFNNIRAVRKFCAMESWCFGSEGKGFVLSDEMVSPSEALVNSRTVLMGWDLKSQCDYESTMPVSGYDANENEGVMKVDFSNVVRKPLPSNPIGGFLCAKIGSEKVSSPTCIFSSKEFFREKDSGSMLLSSVLDFESRKSSLVDLKLGRLADYRDSQNCKSSKAASILSSVPSRVPEKRVRMASFTSQTPLCQVHGCYMDLSNSKEYHKRHKVCAVHSKTAKVIVNGIEQRFCQQCSRFHLLAEFDDDKRSCRKRLAGHNERRRKPQLHNHSGGRFPRNALPTTSSFICPDKCPNSILQPVKHETSSWFRHVKLEDESIYRPQSSIPIMNEHFLLKSAPLYGVDKQYPSLQGFGFCAASGSISYENHNQWPHYLSGSNSITHAVLKSSSSGSEDFTVLDKSSTLQGLSRVSDSSSALSLLSPHSHNSSSHSSGIPMAQPLILQGGHNHSIPESILGIISQASTCLASNRFSSSRINTLKGDHLEPVVVSDTSNANSIQVSDFFQGPDFENVKDPLSCGDATTIYLL